MPLAFLFLQDIPLKEKESFDLSFTFVLKQKPGVILDASVTDPAKNAGDDAMLPYVTLRLQLLKPGLNETRLKLINNHGKILSVKSLGKASTFSFPLGFSDDLKDHVSAHEFDLVFYSPSKEPLNIIRVVFERDGTYSVNGETRGKL